MKVERKGNVAELTVSCRSRRAARRCSRSTSIHLSVWNMYGKDPQQIVVEIRRAFWIIGWKEKPRRGFICPACRGAHDPHQYGHFPPYLKTPK
jgi:hypothetical protein